MSARLDCHAGSTFRRRLRDESNGTLMEKKRSGWWALAGVVLASLLLLLDGYVGAYYTHLSRRFARRRVCLTTSCAWSSPPLTA